MIRSLPFLALVVGSAAVFYALGRYHGARAALRRISEHNQRVAHHQQWEGQ